MSGKEEVKSAQVEEKPKDTEGVDREALPIEGDAAPPTKRTRKRDNVEKVSDNEEREDDDDDEGSGVVDVNREDEDIPFGSMPRPLAPSDRTVRKTLASRATGAAAKVSLLPLEEQLANLLDDQSVPELFSKWLRLPSVKLNTVIRFANRVVDEKDTTTILVNGCNQ